MKIVTIIGARPQFIKAAVISAAIVKQDNMEEVLVHTGQHFDANMSDIFLEQLGIPAPKYMLNINDCSHGEMTGRMIQAIEKVFLKEKPDVTIIYGDTNSTLAGAIAAAKLHIPIAHIEAGLRSNNMLMPEEVNRILSDRISSYLFCTSNQAIDNLKKEGFDSFDCIIENVGDVMKDTANFFKKHAVKIIDNVPDEFFLCTLHRAENTDNPDKLSSIVTALNKIHLEIAPVIIPLHPRTKKILENQNLSLNVHIIEPASYFEMIWLLKNCNGVMTDSGGLQKEAYFFDKYCLTLREETEWVELIEHGYNKIVGYDANDIFNFTKDMLLKGNIKKQGKTSLYGDGKAAERIVSTLYKYLKKAA